MERLYCENASLVKFESVDAELVRPYEIRVTWSTALEMNNNYFEIQHSETGVYWETIGVVESNGSADVIQNYQFIDKRPLVGYNHYRIKQVGFNKDHSYSESVVVSTERDKEAFVVAPNPVYENQTLVLMNIEGIEHIEVINRYGKHARQWHEPRKRIPMDFGTGIFSLRVKTDRGWLTKRIVVQ